MVTEVKTNRSQRTRAELIRVARRLFAERGFGAVSSEEIVAAAGLTRGALYHHFDGKPGLFLAVIDAELAAVRERLRVAAAGAPSPVESMERGIHAFLEAFTDPATRQLVLVDGPAVLGWSAWRDLDLQHGMGLLRTALGAAVDAGQLRIADVDSMTHLLGGALIDGAMLVGRAPDDPELARRVERNLVSLVRGLAVDGDPA